MDFYRFHPTHPYQIQDEICQALKINGDGLQVFKKDNFFWVHFGFELLPEQALIVQQVIDNHVPIQDENYALFN